MEAELARCKSSGLLDESIKRLFLKDFKTFLSHLIQEVIRNVLKYSLHKLISWLHSNINGLGLNYNSLEGPSIVIKGLRQERNRLPASENPPKKPLETFVRSIKRGGLQTPNPELIRDNKKKWEART